MEQLNYVLVEQIRLEGKTRLELLEMLTELEQNKNTLSNMLNDLESSYLNEFQFSLGIDSKDFDKKYNGEFAFMPIVIMRDSLRTSINKTDEIVKHVIEQLSKGEYK